MTDLFAMTIRLNGESMTEFGGCVAQVCVQFPALVVAEIDHLVAAAVDPGIELAAFKATLHTLRDRAAEAVLLGDAVATTIGLCEPVRIDGGPVQ